MTFHTRFIRGPIILSCISHIASSVVILHLASAALYADLPTERLQRLDQYLLEESRRYHLPGFAVAVTSNGEIVHEKIHGNGVHSDSAFLIGSCSKTITALATLIALDEASIDVNSTVQSVLPRLTADGSGEPLKIIHLLQHRSGLVRSQGFDDLPSLEELDKRGHTLQLRRPPGERFAYSNLNYALLGLIIERVAGEPFADFVQRRVFHPAGMTSSFCAPDEKNTVKYAPEHQYCFGFARQVPYTVAAPHQIPAGFIRCSASDLARLQILLLNDGMLDGQQVFPQNIIEQMKTPPGDSEFGYGMGVYRGNHRYGPVIAHEGATPTAYAFHGLLTDDRLGFVMLTNINLFDPFTDHGEAIYENIFRILKGEPPQRTYPIRIWVRWLILGVVLLTIGQLIQFFLKWRKSGWRFQFPTFQKARISIATQLVIPVVIWYAVLRWTQTPLLSVFKLEPDVMWSLAFLTVAGMVTGCLKKCVELAPTSSE